MALSLGIGILVQVKIEFDNFVVKRKQGGIMVPPPETAKLSPKDLADGRCYLLVFIIPLFSFAGLIMAKAQENLTPIIMLQALLLKSCCAIVVPTFLIIRNEKMRRFSFNYVISLLKW